MSKLKQIAGSMRIGGMVDDDDGNMGLLRWASALNNL